MGESADRSKVRQKDFNPLTAKKAEAPAVVKRATKLMRYRSLHHHTTFSYLDGYGLPASHVRRATELGMQGLAVTEHGNVSSHVKLEQAASKEGVQPIYGCELYCGDVHPDRRTQRKNHLTVLASDGAGYRNLLRVVSQGWSDFYYEPTVSGSVLQSHREGLIVLSGCTGSLLATSLTGGKNIDPSEASYERGKQVAARFKKAFGDSYYLEVQAFPTLDNVCKINEMIERMSRELKIPVVATGDVHYTAPSESEMQQILHNVRGGNKQTLEEQARSWGYDVKLSPPISDREIYNRLRATGLSESCAKSAILATEEIAQRCSGVTLPKLPPLKFPTPAGYVDNRAVWRDWLQQGWRFRGCDRMSETDKKRYRERLHYEMSVIEGKDFVDYLLIVSELVKFAKDSGIPVGPARGSAAASLVCWLLRITEVNPLLFNGMIFERFIDPTRADPPDIDLDFDSERRWELREFAVRKYGSDCVNNIGTFTMYKSKNSLDDIGRVYKIPQYEIDVVKELLIERSSGDLRASATIEDTVEMFEEADRVVTKYPELRKAMSLEGNVKGMGVHAAGLVISNGPITDVCAVYQRKVKEVVTDVVSVDKYDAEYLNLLKIDTLALSTMTMIAMALNLLDMPLNDLYGIPLDDPKVIEGFKSNDVVGIFQFDGRAMRSVNAELQPDSFQEIRDVNALARPGPLHNNASAVYIEVKKGRRTPEKLHPLYDRIVEDTHYQVVYQEQILRIVREIGGFDWTHAAYIRKIISKKLGEQEFNRQWERFWSGASERGFEEDMAKKIWGLCITAGSYAFNVAHCVSYGMLAYWTMWLKVYHPAVFYASALSKLNEKKQLELLRDAWRHGIDALPPHPEESGLSWSVNSRGGLQAGLVQLPGIGDKMATAMLEYRSSLKKSPAAERIGPPTFGNWYDYLPVHGYGQKKADNAMEFCETEDPFGIQWLHRRLERTKADVRRIRGLPWPTHTSLQIPYSRGDDTTVVWVGVIRHRNLRELFEVNFSRTGQQLDPKDVKRPDLNEWVIMVGADEDELLTITVDRFKYPKFKRALWGIKLDHDVVLVRGTKKGYQSRRAIYVQDMWVLDPDDEKEEDVGDDAIAG